MHRYKGKTKEKDVTSIVTYNIYAAIALYLYILLTAHVDLSTNLWRYVALRNHFCCSSRCRINVNCFNKRFLSKHLSIFFSHIFFFCNNNMYNKRLWLIFIFQFSYYKAIFLYHVIYETSFRRFTTVHLSLVLCVCVLFT